MSASSETTPPSPPAATVETQSKPTYADLARDTILWRRKYLSILVLLVATAIWVALQVYQFNFVTVVSWVAMVLVTLMFMWGNIHRLLGIEAPEVSGMEISERSAAEMANGIREWVEEGLRWMFRVSSPSQTERGWFLFAATVCSSWLLSMIASRFDLLTLVYAGLVVGMIVPTIYVKYDHKIKEYGCQLRMHSQKCYAIVEEKLRNLKNKVANAAGKKKKTEKKMD